MALSFPPDCNTPRRHMEFCFHAREKLRQLHNKMGYWYRPSEPDVTLAQYNNNFPSPKFDRLRTRYPFASKLTRAQWEDFQKNIHIKIDNKINVELSAALQSINDSSEWTPDLEDIGGL